MKSCPWILLMIACIFLGFAITVIVTKKTGHWQDKRDWPNQNFVCSGYSNSDNPAGVRCNKTSLSNIRDSVGRFMYFCPEHYRQSDWIKKAEERPIEQYYGEPNEVDEHLAAWKCYHEFWKGIDELLEEPEEPAHIHPELLWPEVFTNPDYEYPDTPKAKMMAVADGLAGWGNTRCGAKASVPFGRAMVKIGSVLGVTPIERNLYRLSDEILEDFEPEEPCEPKCCEENP